MKREDNLKRKLILKRFKGNPEKLFGYMRSMKSVKDNVIAFKKKNGELTKTDNCGFAFCLL